MKRADKSAVAEKKFEELISQLSENETLDVQMMYRIRGGEGDGGGDKPIIPPPPPK